MLFTDYIWDFDGTLFDTYPRISTSFREALRQLGCERPEAEILSAVKMSVRGAANDYARRYNLDAREINRLYHEIESALPIDDMTPYPGAEAFLRAVMARGGRHFLYTHRDRGAMKALANHNMADCFCGAITVEDPFPLKPAPDALLHLMKRCAIAPAAAVMLDDRDIDVEAAKNAGIAGCLIDAGHYYDGYRTSLRCERIDDLYALMKL